MDVREICKLILTSFFIIFGCSIIAAQVFTTAMGLGPVCSVHINTIWVLTSLICLTHFVFYSKGKLTRRGMLIRTLIHFYITTALSIAAAIYLGWIVCHRPLQVIVFVVLVATVYLTLFGISEYRHKKTADELNQRLGELFKGD